MDTGDARQSTLYPPVGCLTIIPVRRVRSGIFTAVDFYRYLPRSSGRGALIAVPIDYEPEFRTGIPRQLFSGDYEAPNGGPHTHDVPQHGKRFLMIKPANGAGRAEPRVIIAQNWLAGVKRRLPTE